MHILCEYKNMKSEKGMTLVTTAILVIVIATLVFAFVYYARLQMAKESLQDLKTDMLLIQAKVSTIEGEYTLNKKDDVLKGIKLSEMQEDETIKQFLEKSIIDANEKGKQYYVLNNDNLSELGLNKIILEEGNYYIVEYTTKEVYYIKGFTYSDGNTYYKLSEIEELDIENVK